MKNLNNLKKKPQTRKDNSCVTISEVYKNLQCLEMNHALYHGTMNENKNTSVKGLVGKRWAVTENSILRREAIEQCS